MAHWPSKQTKSVDFMIKLSIFENSNFLTGSVDLINLSRGALVGRSLEQSNCNWLRCD